MGSYLRRMRLQAVATDLTSLDLPLTVAECGRLGQAGRVHGMTQPAVSMRMDQVERQLGLHLLDRTPSGTRLRWAGERLTWRATSRPRPQMMAGRRPGTPTKRSRLPPRTGSRGGCLFAAPAD
jgi:hypothetical protein